MKDMAVALCIKWSRRAVHGTAMQNGEIRCKHLVLNSTVFFPAEGVAALSLTSASDELASGNALIRTHENSCKCVCELAVLG